MACEKQGGNLHSVLCAGPVRVHTAQASVQMESDEEMKKGLGECAAQCGAAKLALAHTAVSFRCMLSSAGHGCLA